MRAVAPKRRRVPIRPPAETSGGLRADMVGAEHPSLDGVPDALITLNGAGFVRGWNAAAEKLSGIQRAAAMGRRLRDVVPYQLASGTDAEITTVLDRGDVWNGVARATAAANATLEVDFMAAPLPGGDGRDGYILVVHDTIRGAHLDQDHEAAESGFGRLVTAGPGLAMVRDGEGRYLFANEAVLLLMGTRAASGWRGRTDEELWEPSVAAQLQESDARTIARGAPTDFDLTVPAGGGVDTILMSTFPLRGASGERLLGTIGINITVRVSDANEARVEGVRRDTRRTSERAAVAGALARLRAVAGINETATAICRAIHALPRLALASITLFELDGSATPIGVASAVGLPRTLPRLKQESTDALRKRAADGPWVEPWTAPNRHPHSRTLRSLGIHHVAYAPIHAGDELVGVLMVGGSSEIGAPELAELLPAVVEFAGLAGALLAPGIAGRPGYREARATLLGVIGHRAFRPVFQPIVDLAEGSTVGYEALTRFDDGADPATRFAAAAATGLGVELELATLKAALQAAKGLSSSMWLSVNVSPRLVLSGAPLRSLLRRHGGDVVCEVTEHEEIGDYTRFRAMIARLPKVKIAIDDAGAGFANFRHVLELRPAYVKFDRSLIAGIDQDLIRQELLRGMLPFMRAARCHLIAEGIETKAELAVLQALGVPLGQGFLLGRAAPAPVDHA